VRPRSRFLRLNGLRHHLLEWGTRGEPVLLLHGFLEHAHAWDFVAPALAAAGRRVFAIDWRGHGQTQWIGDGGYYHFPDYVADLGFVVRALGGHAALVGHSMGAGAAILYAGTEPDRVTALACIEGLGPADMGIDTAPERYSTWIGDLQRGAQREARTLDSIESAAARLRDRFPRFSMKVAHHMAKHATKAAGSARTWRFDPLHQTRAPQPYLVEQARAFWQRIRCPVLFVEGEASSIRRLIPGIDERVRALGAEHVTLADCAHHPHLEKPAETAKRLDDFLSRISSRDRRRA
jgi:pimeloyl-ACP methyl ester carboxylesterase